MIQVLFEFDGGVFSFTPGAAVSGVQVFHHGRCFQVLEGPELEVMAALALLADDTSPMARYDIEARSVRGWRTEFRHKSTLPVVLSDRLVAFAQATSGQTPRDGREAICFLSGLTSANESSATAFGRPVGSRIEGRSGDRAWLAV